MSRPECFATTIKLTKPIDKSVIVQTEWTEVAVKFQLILVDGDHSTSYNSELSIATLQETASQIEVPFDEFLTETKHALSQKDGLENFCYHFVDDKFQWTKRKGEGIMLKYGSVTTHRSEENYCIKILLQTIEVMAELKQEHKVMCTELNQAQALQQQMKEIYEKYVSEQQLIERTNLTKFIALLNEKKQRISWLEDEIRQMAPSGSNKCLNTAAIKENNNEKVETFESSGSTSGDACIIQTVDSSDSISDYRLPKRKRIVKKADDKRADCSRQSPPPGSSIAPPAVSDYDKDTEELYGNM